MCGLVGYVGDQDAWPIVFEGLRRLEYRGYDSAGIAIVDVDGQLQFRKAVGKVDGLVAAHQWDLPRCVSLVHATTKESIREWVKMGKE